MQIFSLQRRLALSPHAFQQACRRGLGTRPQAKKSGQKPTQAKDGRASRPGTNKGTRTQNLDGSIRWYDKDLKSGDITTAADAPEALEAGEVRRQLRDVSTSMRKYAASIDSKEFHDTVVDLFPEHERPALTQALALERARRQDLATSVEVSLEPSPLAAPIARELNKHFLQAANDPQNFKGAGELWKWYLRATRNIPGVHGNIPPAAWAILWRTQINDQMSPESRNERIMELVDGMARAGLVLNADQKEAKLEALVMVGKGKQALMEWEEDFKAAEGKDENNLRHGIKLFAALGDIRNGTQMLKKYQELFPLGDPRIMHTLVAACIQTHNDHMAYSLYLSMRHRLNSRMRATDFDYVAVRFLAHDKMDLALAVFRDMMIQGTQTIQRGKLAAEEEQKMLEGMIYRIDAMHSRSKKTDDVNKISLEALTHLPKQWQNKFFFGKWIKKLIGMNDLDNAAKVIELMYQRGIEPDRGHVNGLIGGLIRSGLPNRVKKGETLAWSMIQKRIELISRRQGRKAPLATKTLSVVSSDHDNHKPKIPLDLSRPAPTANTETFNVLGLNYLLKQDWIYLALLQEMLEPADLIMSSFFMNHLLYMKMYTKGPDEMWSHFLEYTKTTLPDIDTFDCLWQAQQRKTAQRSRVHSPDQAHATQALPAPRTLYATMMGWTDVLDQRKRLKASDGFSEEIYARIISTLCDKNDFASIVPALHGILSRFEAGPSQVIKELIIIGLSNLLEPQAPQIRIGSRAKIQIAANQSRVRGIRLALGRIRERRKESVQGDGQATNQPSEKDLATAEVNLLSELIRTVLLRVHGDASVVEAAILDARAEMGLGDMTMGDRETGDIEMHST
ncbi:hypothetical protein ANO11243_006400 [Dothideomycetidae sp. 11243]|nr:hypothetical protein ANO11243_006400 [fungal sp. No.11243]